MQPRPIMVGLVLALSILVPASVGATEEFGTPQAGRRVYDLAAVLTPAEVDELEVRAEAIERAGAPVIVYLRLHDSSYEETVADARALMDAWDIRSGPGARDGVVLFFNLRPTDPKHGHFAIVAGEAHVRSGALDPAQLDRIARDMLPVLREGQLARGIAIGLEAVHYNLTAGAPSTVPHPVRQLARRVSGWPLNGVGGLASLAILAAVARYWSRTVTVARPASLAPTTMIPGDLAPALAGALVRGRLSEDLLTA
ncbi:MAG: TPM domain-containing protein, partial [Thermomicrobium sp.]|nr:TPM domain-containing protein [Thermomicrobium sp.]